MCPAFSLARQWLSWLRVLSVPGEALVQSAVARLLSPRPRARRAAIISRQWHRKHMCCCRAAAVAAVPVSPAKPRPRSPRARLASPGPEPAGGQAAEGRPRTVAPGDLCVQRAAFHVRRGPVRRVGSCAQPNMGVAWRGPTRDDRPSYRRYSGGLSSVSRGGCGRYAACQSSVHYGAGMLLFLVV